MDTVVNSVQGIDKYLTLYNFNSSNYGLDGEVGIRVPIGARFFSSPRRPDRFWVTLSLLANVYRGLFLWD
jgi:hypothetical protein